MSIPSRKLFVNLAVQDLPRTVAFFDSLGFTFDDEFADEDAACLVIGPSAFAMLMARDRFADFTSKPICDPQTHTQAIFAIELDDPDDVDRMADAALASGGSPANEPMEHDFMYGRSFHDPDGHMWEVFWLDPEAADDEG
jgi:uncharacterized protein